MGTLRRKMALLGFQRPGLRRLWRNWRIYRANREAWTRHAAEGFALDSKALYPCLFDRDEGAGSVDTHYFHQDLWIARHIHDAAPVDHVDIGSRLDGFLAHLLTFRRVTMIDVRPLPYAIDGLDFVEGNATDLSAIPDNSVVSLSCLHALEHFGLGRYGDPVDPSAHRKAAAEFARVLAPGGTLYVSVPCGATNQLQFDAHRIFDPLHLISLFPSLTLDRVDGSLNDHKVLRDIDPALLRSVQYSLGMFFFSKPASSAQEA